MKKQYSILFEPVTIGSCTIKNRFAMAPMGPLGLGDAEGGFNQRGIDYYTERAKGGTGLIITGGNIDTRLLASVLTRELVREQRLVSLRIIGDDRPGHDQMGRPGLKGGGGRGHPLLVAQIAALQSAQDAPTTSSRIKSVLQRAFSLLGTPYRWGGTSPEGGFDCSGLVGYVFRTIGIDLPRVSRSMANEGTAVVDRTALAEGDLVFFGKRGRVDHVGIYIGEGKFLHAPRTGRDVTVSSMDSGYWSQKYLQARRLATGA